MVEGLGFRRHPRGRVVRVKHLRRKGLGFLLKGFRAWDDCM